MGVWEYGSMGVWEYGSMGVWEYGSVKLQLNFYFEPYALNLLPLKGSPSPAISQFQ
jgi:hypothetical protein